MFPVINPGMDNKTRIELLRMTTEQQLAKCERGIVSKDIDPETRAILERYKKELENTLEIIGGLESKGIRQIWKKPKAMAKLAKMITTIKSRYNIQELETINKVIDD
jgi:predicted ATP-grasp superfamily ATP-dependent carboligase